ncbi:hypothetical protein [Rhizobium sp. 11_C7_N12_5]|uniref:hypothetical protein n=1 Tax=Rhizobium sp. 11_C7_N12_5 TaxID=3240770 RepID=UPI003F2722A4
MLKVSFFLQLLRQALETSLQNELPISRDSLEGSIRILKVCEEHSAAMERRLETPDPTALPSNVVSLKAWLEAKQPVSQFPIQ